MLIRRPADIPSSEITPEPVYLGAAGASTLSVPRWTFTTGC